MEHRIHKFKWSSSRLAVVFAKSIEEMCEAANEDEVDAPTTSEWSTTLLPSKVRLKAGLYSTHAYARTYADCRRSCLYFCRRLRPAHKPTVAVKVQTCWTFKASADQRRHSSQSRKRCKVTEGRRVVLHGDVCGRISTHTLACLYYYPRRNVRYAVATRRQPQAWTSAWTSAPAAGAFARMEYTPGLILGVWKYTKLSFPNNRSRHANILINKE